MSIAHAVAVSSSERRSSARHPRALKVKWRVLGARDYSYAAAMLHNVSTTGLALLFDETFPAGTVLIVQLEGVAEKYAEPMLLRVEWSTQQKNKKWQVGCSFSCPLSEDDLKALLESARKFVPPAAAPVEPVTKETAVVDPFLAGSAGERRGSVRRKRSSVTVFVSRSEGAREIEGAVVERSLSGLGIMVPAPFTRGSVLRVRLQHANVPPFQVQVRNCRQQGKQWILGCHFTQTPPANVMLFLG
jgi:PilZ domain